MKQTILILLSTMSVLTSCTTKKQDTEKTDGTTPPTKTSSQTCYRYVNKRDTVLLNATYAGDSVKGMLMYNFFEKDKNTGTIQGKLTNDILIADYMFMSEGVQSVRQVAFKTNGRSLVEGFGDIEEKNGKTVFKNADSLTFDNSVVLSEVDCNK